MGVHETKAVTEGRKPCTRNWSIGKISEENLWKLAAIYNSSIEGATVNEEWLRSYLLPVLKPFTDETNIQECPVVTVQNTIGNLLKNTITW